MAAKKAPKRKKTSSRKTRARSATQKSEEKWGRELWRAGWTALPSVVLQHQKALRLTPLDINVLMHLVSYWWDAQRLPFPSKRSIADCVGRDPRTVQRSIQKMEDQGLLRRKYRIGATTEYDFRGLIKAATPFAEEALDARVERKRQKTFARRRKQAKARE